MILIMKKYIVILAVVWCANLALAAAKPNILFILADDMGYSDMSWQGSPIQTPNLDKLRAGGMFLERNYVQPQCTPSRVAFLTGNYPYRFGLHEHIGSILRSMGFWARLKRSRKRCRRAATAPR